MTQKNKNIILAMAVVLLLASAVLISRTGRNARRQDFDDRKFTVTDTASVDKVVMKGKSLSNMIERVDGQWMVNRRYPLDPSMNKVLMAVLNDVRIHRSAPRKLIPEIRESLQDNGIRVMIYAKGNLVQSFSAGGNNISVSYFMGSDGEPYLVYLPGYDSYVSGIFEVSENDWRDRLVFTTTWSGLKSLTLDYPGNKKESFKITSGKELPVIEGMPSTDTARVMDYLALYQMFAVDQYLDSGRVARYDSVCSTPPRIVLTLDAVNLNKPLTIKFFRRIPRDPFIAGEIGKNQRVLFSYERIKEIFKTCSYFLKP